MKKQLILLIILLICFLHGYSHEKDSLHSKSLRFVENKGQWDDRIKFNAPLNEGYLQCLNNSLQFVFRNQEQYNKLLAYKLSKDSPKAEEFIIDYHAYRINFVNSSEKAKILPTLLAEDYENYFLGNDPKKFASNVQNFGKIMYQNLWSGIDMELFENEHLLKYQFIVAPGANPKNIVMDYAGVNNISIQQRNLIIKTSVNQVTELAPVAYQIIDGNEIIVPCKFVLQGNILHFDFPEKYNKNYPLIIDPVLIFSTYSGSIADNWGFTATFDDVGNTYSGGICFNDVANGYPVTPGAFQINWAGGEGSWGSGCDVAIIKYGTTGNRLYATYLGGNKNDLPHSTIVDKNGNLLIYGTTGSSNFPMGPNPYDATFNGGPNITYDGVLTFSTGVDIFIAKLNSIGTQLLSATYLGGTNNDGLNLFAPLSHNYADGARGEVNVDENNNIYIVSNTSSSNFPVTVNSFQNVYAGGTNDGIISVLDNNLSNLIWSSFIGGSGLDAAYGIVMDDNSDLFVCGGTTSTNFPTTTGSFQTTYNGGPSDGFLTKISNNGNSILKSTFVGTGFYDQTYLIDRSKQGHIFVYGQTNEIGNSFIFNAAWNQPGGGQFITKFNADLSSRVWSTAFGTGGGVINIAPTAFLVDLCAKIYISGWGGLNGTGGTNGLPISGNAFQNTTDNADFYLLVIKDDASAMDYGTFFGGPTSQEHVDGGTSRFDRKGKIYQSVCAGCGGNDDFPTTAGVWSNTNNSGNCNNGTFKFDFLLPVTIADFLIPPVICIPTSISFNNTSYSGGTGMTYQWNFGDGTTSTLQHPTHNYTQSGIYNVTLVATDMGTCNFSDTVIKQVLVLSNTSDTLPAEHICLGDMTQIGILPTPDPTITYQWLPTIGLSDPTTNNPFANPSVTTTYTLLVSNGVCTDTLKQLVNVYQLEGISIDDTATCDGNITLTASTGQGVNSFHWSSNNQFTDWLNSNAQNPTFSTQITGPTYYYIMVENDYCAGIDSILVTFSVVADSFNIQHPSCFDSCNGMAAVVVLAGNSPYQYLWNTGSTNDSIFNLCNGSYTVTVTDNDNCKSISTVSISEPPPINVLAAIYHNPCTEVCVGEIVLQVSGGTPPYTYQWGNGQSTSTATGLCNGAAEVIITDDEGCQQSESFAIVTDSIFAHIHAYADDDTIYAGQSTGLHVNYIPNCFYQWTPSNTLDNPTSANPTATPLQTTTYVVMLSDANGCITYDTVRIVVLEVYCEEPYIFVPNAFSPDGDGQNDLLYVRGKMISEMNFLVYDRWGEKVFESNQTAQGWDGKYKGKPCDPGVFVYYLDATCYNKAQYLKKGNVTIIK